jgi:hypothetical protein
MLLLLFAQKVKERKLTVELWIASCLAMTGNLLSPVFFYYTSMLAIKNLHASVADTEILHGIDISFEKWKNTCILGKNGSGKSSLASIIMGNPAYRVTGGSITLDNEDLLTMSPEERSLAGIFLSFQNVTEIKGIKVSEYLRTIYNLHLPRIAPGTNPLSPMLFSQVREASASEAAIFPKHFSNETSMSDFLVVKSENSRYYSWNSWNRPTSSSMR